MSEYLNLGFNIAVAVFIGLGVVFGFIRGLRKTASRGIFLILITIVTLFITIPITNAILGIKFNTTLNLGETSISGQLSIDEILSVLLEEFIGKDFVTNNPEFAGIIVSIPILMINSIVYVLLFLILKDLLMPLNYVFYRFTFAPKKKKENLNFSANNDDDSHPLGNIFDLASIDDISKEESEMQESIKEEQQFKPVDNSLFTPQSFANNNTAGVFISKDPENVDVHGKAPVFDFSENKEESEKKKEKKKKQKKEKKEKQENSKPKKYRLLGGLLGCFVGILIMSNTLLPIYSAIDILKTANAIKLENIGDKTFDLNTATDGITGDIINSYESSALKFVSKYTGMEGLALAEFDYLTTQNIGNQKINLREDLAAIVKTIENVDNLIGKYKTFTGENSFSNLDKNQLSILIDDTKNVIVSAKDIKMVDCLTEYILPMTCSILLKDDFVLSNNKDMNTMIKSSLRSISAANKINTFDEFNALLDLAKYLNDKNILAKLLHNDFSDPIAIINSLDNQLVEKLFALKTIDVAIPHILNIGFTILDESIKFGYVKNENEADTIKTSFTNFVNNVLEFAKTVNTNSTILITNNSLIPLGKVLETIKSSGLVNNDTYENLLDFLSNKIEDIISDILPEEFNEYINNEFLKNFTKVDNWEYEMICINNAVTKLRNVEYGILGKVIENETLRQGLSIELPMKEGVLQNLGEALDMLEETCLFGAVTTKVHNDEPHKISGTASFMLSALNYAKTLIDDEFGEDAEIQNISKVFDEMKVNLITSHHTFAKDNPFWKNEFTSIEPLIINMYNILKSKDFELNETLGQNLDKAKESVLFGYKHGSQEIRNNTSLTLMDVALGIVKDEILPEGYTYNNGSNINNKQTINDKIYELFDTIDQNLRTNACKTEVLKRNFWKKEITYFISLNKLSEKATNISNVSDAVKLSVDLDEVYKSYIIPRGQINNLIAYAVRQTKDNTTTDQIQLEINNTIENIACRLENPEFFDNKELENFWQIEFGHIEHLTNIKYTDESEYSVKDNLDKIGQSLDEILNGYTKDEIDIRGSYLINHHDIGKIISLSIIETKNNLIPVTDNNTTLINAFDKAITDVANNFNNDIITKNISYKSELEKISSLSKINIDESLFTYKDDRSPEDHAKLFRDLGQKIDSISFNKDTLQYKYNEEKNSKIVTRNILNTLIIDMFNTAKIQKIKKNSIDLSFNYLVSNIQKEISTHNTKDTYFSWQRELSYFNTLISLSADKTYKIDTIESSIGWNIDKIAFNQQETNGALVFKDIIFDNENNCTTIPNNGNSLFITRAALINTMYGSDDPADQNPGLLNTVKYDTSDSNNELEKEKKEIVNEIIDNSGSIALTNSDLNNSNKYKNVEESFNDIATIDDAISSKVTIVNGTNITDFTGKSKLGQDIDSMLNTLEGKIACGIQTTRRITILILNHIAIPEAIIDTPAGKYHTELHNNFTSRYNNNSTNSEDYEESKPFEILFESVS